MKRTGYDAKFRDVTKTLWRHLFATEQGLMVYTGNFLQGIKDGETVTILGTVKRIENFGGGTVRISRPKIIDENMPIFLDGKSGKD